MTKGIEGTILRLVAEERMEWLSKGSIYPMYTHVSEGASLKGVVVKIDTYLGILVTALGNDVVAKRCCIYRGSWQRFVTTVGSLGGWNERFVTVDYRSPRTIKRLLFRITQNPLTALYSHLKTSR